MSKPANPTLIGAFVLSALALLVAGILVLGGGKLFRSSIPLVMYFQGSVAGLSVGSPVTFRGVRVGQVTNVFISYDDAAHEVVIPVFAEFFPDNIVSLSSTGTENSRNGDRIHRAVEQGLRAQLTTQSLVTGQLVVNLDYFPNSAANLSPNFYRDRIEIPTVPSTIQEVQATLQQVYTKIQQLPLEQMIDSTTSLLQGANRIVNDPRIGQAVDTATQTMAELQRIARNLDRDVPALMRSLQTVSTNAASALDTIRVRADDSKETIRQADLSLEAARQTMEEMQAFLRNANTVVGPTSPVQHELVVALREFTSTARSLQALADTLARSRNPVLFGRTLDVPLE